ncbi:UNVERIFIED_CONTAM: putative LRR receptor-like serine/threonine-protein kinase [Sesamum angustifolium]|uniref:non-specific serine/threonine protein kinase n=1 Tax=Sesamum angustifolium TaxID=2727405 RepID=A0AAW2PCI7_9LAMI
MFQRHARNINGGSHSCWNIPVEELDQFDIKELLNCWCNSTILRRLEYAKNSRSQFQHVEWRNPKQFPRAGESGLLLIILSRVDLHFACRFLSHNSLTGEVPGWILDSRQKNMDLSYNNFTQSSVAGCQFSNINLVASHSTLASNSTGGTWDRGRFIAANYSSMISPVAEIYQTARLSPSSLKYYGLCLRKGSYRVRLHFAEIMYDDNSTFTSLGRRIFDVAIQGQVVLSDFDIAQEAKGVRTGIYRDFNILVNGSTLEIHLYWTGKGTTAIPDRGVYGPLISAIAVTPNFDVSTGLSVGAIIGIVVSSCGGRVIDFTCSLEGRVSGKRS